MSGDPDDPVLLALAAAIADGAPVDWAALDAAAPDRDTRDQLEQLREIERFVAAHRPAETGDQPAAAPQSSTWRHLVLFEAVGQGAFGAVYRGWDPRLEREVAVKLLTPDASSTDSPLHEARHLARVRHSNIVTIYGADVEEGRAGIWMEFIEGRTLAAMVREAGPMSAREAIGIGVDLCRALSALHASGLLHRDIKAHNVMREIGGRIVLMDFSGVQAQQPDGESPGLSGTPLYMAPELFRGGAATVSSDVYSLGVLLFFLLTGEVPVDAPDVRGLEAAHAGRTRQRLRDLRPDLSEAIVQVVERAAAPDVADRYRTMGELEQALATAGSLRVFDAAETGPVPQPTPKPFRTGRWVAAGVVVLALLAVAAAAMYARRDPQVPPVVRFSIGPPYLGGSWPRLSPDGRQVVFGTVVEGRNRFWIRAIDSLEGRALMDTGATETPFWSPDSRTLAFFADGKLKKVDIDGGEVETIADAPHPRGGDWSGNILIYVGDNGAVARIATDGTGFAFVTEVDRARGDYQHGWPRFLPDGRRFLYMIRSANAERSGIYVGSLDGGQPVKLMPAYSRVAYGGGYLLYVRDGTLLAQPFDPQTAMLSGDARVVVGRVKAHAAGDAAFDVASSGLLIYNLDPGQPSSRLMVFDRRGRELQALTGPGFFRHPRLSPDGERVVAEKVDPATNNPDLWLFGVRSRSAAKLTNSNAPDVRPVWSPDGTRVAFSSKRGPAYSVYSMKVDGLEPEHQLIESQGDTFIEHWSADGGYVSATVLRNGLWVFPIGKREKPRPVRENVRAGTWQSEFSPDGRWLAYMSEESGTPEVYVEPFPANGSRWQVSSQGGAEPHWARNGQELYFLSAAGSVMSIDLTVPTWQTAPPRPLFRVSVPDLAGSSDYAVSPDGETFIVNVFLADPVVPPIDVVVNWTSMLER